MNNSSEEIIIPMNNSSLPKWYAVGRVMNHEKLVCHYATNIIDSPGVLYGHNPFHHHFPVLLAQMVLIFFCTRITHLMLRPCRQTMIISQVVAGILMGPSLLSQSKTFVELFFPEATRVVIRTIAEFGLILYIFIKGVQTDVQLLASVGRKETMVGLSTIAVSVALGGTAYVLVQRYSPLEFETAYVVARFVPVSGITSFVVISILLTELNILNSELGRLASSASLVTDVFGWFMGFIMNNIVQAIDNAALKPLITIPYTLSYYFTLFFILRPFVMWIVSRGEEKKMISESQFLSIVCVAIGASFVGEYLGQHASFSVFLFGLSLPSGPPLGVYLEKKLDMVASGLLLPLYCTISGIRTDMCSLLNNSSLKIEFIIISGYLGKYLGAMLSSVYFVIPYQEALLIGLIMCCRGITDLSIYSLYRDNQVLSSQLYTLFIMNMVFVTALSTAVVVSVYDPSSRYAGSARRAIITTQENIDLRILVCIVKEENVLPIIKLLQASNPTRTNPIYVFVLQLVELLGKSVATLQPHDKPQKSGSNTACSVQIVNAFNGFERHANKNVVVQHFTAIAPYSSMQNDICTVALDKKVNIIIVPFHQVWSIDGKAQAGCNQLRSVNRNVLKNAPCSVGVLVDRSEAYGKNSVNLTEPYRQIGLLFTGGTDDMEALAYGKRMAEHPHVSLTVVLFRERGSNEYRKEKRRRDYENDEITILRNKSIGTNITFKEEFVKDGNDTTQVIQMMNDDFDLVILGKHHDTNSPVTSGLTEWSEFPELGVIGDMLASSDYRFSVLVVQEQPAESRIE
ncbi:hypothetical protein ACFE04_015935 [Oxalis oulophora]